MKFMKKNGFGYFFQVSEEGKSDNDNELKIFWVTYKSRTILNVLNNQNEIFKIGIFSYPLNFFNF